ncbi:MAG: hypothetical protein RSI06_09245 [Lachnospiraceae bacterium]
MQGQLDSIDVEEHPQKGLKLDEIISTLNSMIDFSGTADVKAPCICLSAQAALKQR